MVWMLNSEFVEQPQPLFQAACRDTAGPGAGTSVPTGCGGWKRSVWPAGEGKA